YEAPMYGHVVRPVVISPGSQRVISHAPVVATVRETVKVRDGGYGWSRSSGGHSGLFGHHHGGHGRGRGLFDH
ncbi:MAG: hypothetical protein ABL893_20545, partial [Hyphomicrobium sp.]